MVETPRRTEPDEPSAGGGPALFEKDAERQAGPANPDLIKVTEIFLVPSSFLVAALGTADTNVHRALVSLLGLIVSGLWYVCSQEAIAEHRQVHPDSSLRTSIMSRLSLIFVIGWFLSMVGHAVLWNRPLGP